MFDSLFALQGLEDALKTLDRLEISSSSSSNANFHHSHHYPHQNQSLLTVRDGGGGGVSDQSVLLKMRAALDTICDEYNECMNYMSKMAKSLTKVRQNENTFNPFLTRSCPLLDATL